MDDGPFPCGRIRTFLRDDDGSIEINHWPHFASQDLPDSKGVPPGFVGIEALQMRSTPRQVPIRRWLEDGTSICLIDSKSLIFTDEGFIVALIAEGIVGSSTMDVFKFDIAGDIRQIDWDIVRRDKNILCDLLQFKPGIKKVESLRKHFSGFVSSLRSRASSLSFGHYETSPWPLFHWSSIDEGRDKDE